MWGLLILAALVGLVIVLGTKYSARNFMSNIIEPAELLNTKRFKQWLKLMNYRQTAASKELGLSRSTIYRYTCGVSDCARQDDRDVLATENARLTNSTFGKPTGAEIGAAAGSSQAGAEDLRAAEQRPVSPAVKGSGSSPGYRRLGPSRACSRRAMPPDGPRLPARH